MLNNAISWVLVVLCVFIDLCSIVARIRGQSSPRWLIGIVGRDITRSPRTFYKRLTSLVVMCIALELSSYGLDLPGLRKYTELWLKIGILLIIIIINTANFQRERRNGRLYS